MAVELSHSCARGDYPQHRRSILVNIRASARWSNCDRDAVAIELPFANDPRCYKRAARRLSRMDAKTPHWKGVITQFLRRFPGASYTEIARRLTTACACVRICDSDWYQRNVEARKVTCGGRTPIRGRIAKTSMPTLQRQTDKPCMSCEWPISNFWKPPIFL